MKYPFLSIIQNDPSAPKSAVSSEVVLCLQHPYKRDQLGAVSAVVRLSISAQISVPISRLLSICDK